MWKLPKIKEENSGIYKIENIINGKFYIGSSKELRRRFVNHFRKLITGNHSSVKFQNSFNKYGCNAFEVSVLEYCEIDKLIEREQYYLDILLEAQEYIKKKKSIFSELGLNICPTASNSLGRIVSKETSEKISKSLRKSYKSGKSKPRKGKDHHYYGKSSANKNRKFGKSPMRKYVVQIDKNFKEVHRYFIDQLEGSFEYSRKTISKRCNEKSNLKYKGYYWRYADEWEKSAKSVILDLKCKNIKNPEIGRNQHLNKPIVQIDKSTKEVIKEWDSMAEAARQIDIDHTLIYKVLKGKTKSTYGFIFKYV